MVIFDISMFPFNISYCYIIFMSIVRFGLIVDISDFEFVSVLLILRVYLG